MKKILILFAVLALMGQAHAQDYTYNHDESKMQQFNVMEVGAGALTPDLWYNTVHGSYKRGANLPTSVKGQLRLTTYLASQPQVDYADSIKEDLKRRAKVELLNVADREVDAAWLTEGNKINNRLLSYKSNISYLNGKTTLDEIDEWTDLGKQYDFAINVTKKAYMPNSERQKQYLAIYDEITKSNDALLSRIHYLALKQKADALLGAFSNFHHRVKENATSSYNRWRDNASSASATKNTKK